MALERRHRIARDLRIGPLIGGGKPYLQIICHANHTGHAFCSGFGFELFGMAAHETGQRDNPVLRGHGNIAHVNARIGLEFGLDVPFDVAIASHISSSSFGL